MATSQPRPASNRARSLPTRRPPVINTAFVRGGLDDRRDSDIAISEAFPEDIGDAGAAIRGAGQDEEQVAEPVQVDDDSRGDILPRGTGERHGQSLGAAADGPRQVELRGGWRASG